MENVINYITIADSVGYEHFDLLYTRPGGEINVSKPVKPWNIVINRQYVACNCIATGFLAQPIKFFQVYIIL